jgi:hypothetical protein
LKTVKEKKQITCKGKPIKTTADFATETLKARREWSEVHWVLNENKPYDTQPSKTIIQNQCRNKRLP